jgi:Ca2+-binding EF-hand superfamily protein
MDRYHKVVQKLDDGVPKPCGRIGVGLRAKITALLAKLVRARHVPRGEETQEERLVADLLAARKSGASAPASTSAANDVSWKAKAIFDRFAKNRKGLTILELRNALSFYSLDTGQTEAKELMKAYDDSQDGKLQLREFAMLIRDVDSKTLTGTPSNTQIPQEVLDTFNEFDKNKTGWLHYVQLRKALMTFDLDLSLPHVVEIMKRYVSTNDGRMEVHEFALLVNDLQQGIIRIFNSARTSVARKTVAQASEQDRLGGSQSLPPPASGKWVGGLWVPKQSEHRPATSSPAKEVSFARPPPTALLDA